MSQPEPLRGGQLTVIEGRDGWLFLDRFEQYDVMRLYTDETAISEEVFETWARALARRQAYFDRAGIAHLTLIVPDACLVCSDKLPEGLRLAARTPFVRLDARLDDAVRARRVYPLQTLIDGRSRAETFQPIDSHWTDWGAFLGYRAALEALVPRVPNLRLLELDDLEWSRRRSFGALGSVVVPERSADLPVVTIKRPKSRKTFWVQTEVREGYEVHEQDDRSLPTALIFRDSAMTRAAQFFSESFRRVAYVTSPNTVLYDLVEREKPDVTIFEVGERRLFLPPDEPSSIDFRATFGDLLLGDGLAIQAQCRSRSLLSEGRLKEALAENDRVLERVQPTARLMLYRARVHRLLGRRDAAIEALRRATDLDPSDDEGWNLLAAAFAEGGLTVEADRARARAKEAAAPRVAAWPTRSGSRSMRSNLDEVNNDCVAGWVFDPAEPSRRVGVQVLYNGHPLSTTLAQFHRPDLLQAKIGDGSHAFWVALPALDAPESAEISVLVADTREPIGTPRTIARQPMRWANGLTAAEMLRLHKIPLYSVQAIAFNGEKFTVAGLHLPPSGSPSALEVRSTRGVAFSFDYPQHLPRVRDWYWYWPNAEWSGFRIEIDLAASTAAGADFEFVFETSARDPAEGALGRNRIYLPKDLNCYQTFPRGNLLTRVHTFDNNSRVAIGGYVAYRTLVTAVEEYGGRLAGANVLDWGCGHGRVIRHFQQQGAAAEAWAVDIDRENIAWVQDHLPAVRARAVPLMPPTELPSEHFDVIYGISVMTHLRRDVQRAWLKELRRVARPGALLLLTFHGRTAVAYASRFLSQEWLNRWLSTGFDDSLESRDLAGKIDSEDYYRNTHQLPGFTRQSWGEYFEVLAIHDCIFGYQDLAVLRAPS